MLMIIKIPEHARFKVYEEGVTEDMIKEAIKKGSKYKQTGGFLCVYNYYSVAYKTIGKNVYKIKTVYLNR